jgi:hypothetical protein
MFSQFAHHYETFHVADAWCHLCTAFENKYRRTDLLLIKRRSLIARLGPWMETTSLHWHFLPTDPRQIPDEPFIPNKDPPIQQGAYSDASIDRCPIRNFCRTRCQPLLKTESKMTDLGESQQPYHSNNGFINMSALRRDKPRRLRGSCNLKLYIRRSYEAHESITYWCIDCSFKLCAMVCASTQEHHFEQSLF